MLLAEVLDRLIDEQSQSSLMTEQLWQLRQQIDPRNRMGLYRHREPRPLYIGLTRTQDTEGGTCD